MSIEIVTPGLQTTVQDLGRKGWLAVGVGQSGAADELSLRLGNHLLGNSEGAAGLEVTMRGPRLRFQRDSFFVLTGADIAAEIDGQDVPMRRPERAQAGAELALGACRSGARSYVCVAGGLDVPLRLGSRSTDVSGRLGGVSGRPLQRGDVLPLGTGARFGPEPRFSIRADAATQLPEHGDVTLRVTLGTHAAALDASSRAAFFSATWQITAEASRMGLRLAGDWKMGAALPELISEPIVPGTVQVPPSGQPIVLGVEAPTTGGYPRVAQVIAADLPLLGQLRPGDTLRFAEVAPQAARAAWRRQAELLDRIALAMELRAKWG